MGVKTVLYIGGFEMPDKNAAAHRVLSIAKALKEDGFLVSFYGVTRDGDTKGVVSGFNYEAQIYPSSKGAWVKYALGLGIITYLKRNKPNYIITYNYPAIAQDRIIRYCRNHRIKVLGDITEWYQPKDFFKKVDTLFRMSVSNKHLDGIIAISRYLADYYRNKRVLCLPPLVDKTEDKWKKGINDSQSKEQSIIRLIYVGSPSAGKDRLDYIIKGLECVENKRISLGIVGIDEKKYFDIYCKTIPQKIRERVIFHGLVPHSDAISLLKQSDFQVFFRESSLLNNAGFPTKLVESISAGVPVITNRISNISDYVRNGFNSLIIDEPTDISIQTALCRVSSMTHEEITQIKKNIDSSMFDYHNYINDIAVFINNL